MYIAIYIHTDMLLLVYTYIYIPCDLLNMVDGDLPNGAFKLTNESHFNFIVTLAASWAMSLFCKDTVVKICLYISTLNNNVLHIYAYILNYQARHSCLCYNYMCICCLHNLYPMDIGVHNHMYMYTSDVIPWIATYLQYI